MPWGLVLSSYLLLLMKCSQMMLDCCLSRKKYCASKKGAIETDVHGDKKDSVIASQTLDLTSGFEVGPTTNGARDLVSCHSARSVLTIAFQFPFDNSLQDNVAVMARQYICSVISSVQRVAMAIFPSGINSAVGSKLSPGSPEALTLANWIYCSYSYYLGAELLRSDSLIGESVLKHLWHHQDAILCCSLKSVPVFIFANQGGLDMLETTWVALQDIMWCLVLTTSCEGREN
ncbi:homeobox-leucine zipper protein REVOLUTA-like [Arachis ipaensis]|uniref:homeobox-leucine zipper protein REVOLUTA-like n=1 Tax=Arachis ipaensis TaxID=130454 RepID=UPI000A2B93C6|nr:homeobox-leucine zipper protein REVOLUTA-like [Arachis ipaensis]